MKLRILSVTIVLVAFSLVLTSAAREDEFKIKEYNAFHHLLHMLQHEALPQNDLKTIRAKAPELVKLGGAIVKLGVPKGTPADKVEDFKAALGRFEKALDKYDTDAKSGSDNTMKNSYIAVHDTFEELADKLPRS